MEQYIDLAIPMLLIFYFLRLCYAPLKLGVTIIVNRVSGFACLWLLNLISGFTGIFFHITLVSVLIARSLGLPGIALLGLLQIAM